jgi:hypothetical protein
MWSKHHPWRDKGACSFGVECNSERRPTTHSTRPEIEGSGASKENDGLIGGEIFRRFKLILDYSRKRMILEPNNHFNDPYELTTGEE